MPTVVPGSSNALADPCLVPCDWRQQSLLLFSADRSEPQSKPRSGQVWSRSGRPIRKWSAETSCSVDIIKIRWSYCIHILLGPVSHCCLVLVSQLDLSSSHLLLQTGWFQTFVFQPPLFAANWAFAAQAAIVFVGLSHSWNKVSASWFCYTVFWQPAVQLPTVGSTRSSAQILFAIARPCRHGFRNHFQLCAHHAKIYIAGQSNILKSILLLCLLASKSIWDTWEFHKSHSNMGKGVLLWEVHWLRRRRRRRLSMDILINFKNCISYLH